MSHSNKTNGKMTNSGLMLLLAGGFVTMFDMFVVNLAIPNIRADLNASFAEIGFVVAAYQLTFGVFLIAGGRLGDLYGRRYLYQLGMLGFAITSGLCAMAWTPTILIVARLFQGATAALLLPQVYSLIRISYDVDKRRWAFGLLGMTMGMGAISGQILGGLLVKADVLELGWRLIFFINLPIGIVIVWRCNTISESKVNQSQLLDWIGTAIASVGLCLFLFSLMQGPSAGWPIGIYLLLMSSIIILLYFIRFERALSQMGGCPAIEMSLFKQRVFGCGTLIVLLISSTSASFFLCMAFLLQSGLGCDPFVAGMVFVPANLFFSLTSLAAAKLVARFGNGAIGWGMVLYVLAIALLSGIVGWQKSDLSLWYLLPTMCLFGAGQAMSMTPLTNLVIGTVSSQQAGMAAGVISTMQQVGGALGVAVVSMIFVWLLERAEAATARVGEAYALAFSGSLLFNLIAAALAAVTMFWVARSN